MNWFNGEVSEAIQKAIGEKKIFIVFVRDDNEQSQQMNEFWDTDEVKDIFTDDVCVAINITVDSVAGKQFGAIYPIAFLPSTFFIENDGIPAAIFPMMEKEEFLKKSKTLMKVLHEMENNDDTKLNDETEHHVTAEPLTTSSVDNAQRSTDDLNTESEISGKEKADALMERVRIKKAEKEKEEAKERERKRRDEGRELSQARRDIAERQAKQLADDIAKKRSEEKAARERVRQQIKQDREARSAKYEADRKAREGTLQKKTAEKEASAQALKIARSESNVTRIQFRLPNGSTSSKQFDSDAKFIVVVDHVSKELVPHLPVVRLTTVYPKHDYNQEDHSKSLRELGLTPNASIIVSPSRIPSGSPSTSLNPLSIIMVVLASLFALIKWFFSLFTSSTSNETSPLSQTQQQQQQHGMSTNNLRNDPSVRRRNLESSQTSTRSSNIRRLHDDKADDDDDNATWNGNSTQQM